MENIDIKSFINVGFHGWNEPCRHWWIKICETNNVEWKIIEVFEKNVIDAINAGCDPQKIIIQNIINVDLLPPADCLMFWHGPEHIEKEAFKNILPKLETKYKHLIFGMPLGMEPQGSAYNNPYENHVSEWNSDEWKTRGYNVIEVRDGRAFFHITAYKQNW